VFEPTTPGYEHSPKNNTLSCYISLGASRGLSVMLRTKGLSVVYTMGGNPKKCILKFGRHTLPPGGPSRYSAKEELLYALSETLSHI